MISPTAVIAVTLSYIGGLFAIAYLVDKKYNQGRDLTNNAIIYTLSLAIYCTAWTFYGNVGLAATTSYLFIGVYIGPTLFFIFWRKILKRIFEIKNKYAITSIAGFLSSRYGKSSAVGAIASLIALIGIIPYLSLQLKAIFTSYAVVTTGSNIHVNRSQVDWIVLVSIIVFIIMFGLRRLDQTEKHPGMVMVVVIQSVVKLVAFLVVGIFATYFLYGGFGDIFSRVGANSEIMSSLKSNAPSYSLFMAYTLLSMSAIMFLPRQFHMAVVENANEKHTRTAVWLLPLYLIVITLFVFPIAMAGILQGYDTKLSDVFILLLPLASGNALISLLVFIGGLSAAISMILIVGITITSMTANYLVLPLLEKIRLDFIRRRLLFVRWMIVILLMLIAYLFEVKIGSSYVLVKIGMISFAAVLQFAPAMIGALYWEKGSKAGVIWGLSAGFSVWFYTSLFPALVRSGWLNASIISDGPLGMRFLRPENLFGVTSLDPLAMTFLFSMLFNVGFFVAGSLFFGQSEKEKQIVSDFFETDDKHAFQKNSTSSYGELVDFPKKMSIINSVFSEYVSVEESRKLAEYCAGKTGLAERKKSITLTELADLSRLVEKTLSSYIGAPAANEAVTKANLISQKETACLSDVYARMVADLKLTPKELGEKINLYKEKEKILAKQQDELERMVSERTKELKEKNVELERFNSMTVGRELRMIELKKRISELEEKMASDGKEAQNIPSVGERNNNS
jgi:Na+/proline symporter